MISIAVLLVKMVKTVIERIQEWRFERVLRNWAKSFRERRSHE